jgi:hypothetical protein
MGNGVDFCSFGAEDEIAVRDKIRDNRANVSVSRFLPDKKRWLTFSVQFSDWKLWALGLSGGAALLFFIISNALEKRVNDLAENEKSCGLERNLWS